MGNVVGIPDSIRSEDVNNIIYTAKEKGYQHLNMKVPTASKKATNILLQSGFRLVDTQLVYRLSTKSISCNLLDNIEYRKFENKDRLQIGCIARDAYSLDQFHSDDKLPKHRCDKYYIEWINNSCDGFADKVMVLSQADTVVGYITVKYKEDNSAVVGLAAIGKSFQRRGYFTYLIGQTLQMLYEERIYYLFYGTQLANEPVLHVMSKYFGIPVFSNHVLHLMI